MEYSKDCLALDIKQQRYQGILQIMETDNPATLGLGYKAGSANM